MDKLEQRVKEKDFELAQLLKAILQGERPESVSNGRLAKLRARLMGNEGENGRAVEWSDWDRWSDWGDWVK